MSGKKNRHKHRHQQRGQSRELLAELNSLRELLGTDDLGDIPILDQVAPSDRPGGATDSTPQMPEPAPLDPSELPILFSPVDEEPVEDMLGELSESERALLQPLNALPRPADTSIEPVGVPADAAAQKGRKQRKQRREEHQHELFAESAAEEKENPFLPAHIRARLTGGKVPTGEAEADRPLDETPEELLLSGEQAPEGLEPPVAPEENLATEQTDSGTDRIEAAPAEHDAQPNRGAREGEATSPQRQQLVDRLVAQQLPELERQLRARIEQMLDELETRR